MSHYNNYGGGGGGYNNYGRNNFSNHKINEDDVPASKHAIFIRGLPASIGFEEIKDFFEEKIGPCSFDFQKINHERQSLFVAVRFETREAAKEAYYKYREEDILGVRCEVTWFRDIRRYISYQQTRGSGRFSNGGGRGGGDNRRLPGRYYGNGRDHSDERRSRRYSDDRRSRSDSRSDRSKSRSSRSRSRSRSLSDGERRSTSRDSDGRRSESREDRKRRKEKKKRSRKDKKRDRRSGSASSKSDGERSSASESEPEEKRKKKDDRKNGGSARSSRASSPLRLTPPPPAPFVGPVMTPEQPKAPLKISIAPKPSPVPVENTSFKLQLDTDEPPKRIIRPIITPPPKDDDAMDIEQDDEKTQSPPAVEKDKEKTPAKVAAVEPVAEKGGWRRVNEDGSITINTQSKSGPPSDLAPEPTPAPVEEVMKLRKDTQPPPSVVTASPASSNDEMVPRSVTRQPLPQPGVFIPPPRMTPSSTLVATPPSKPPPQGPPPSRVSIGGGRGRFPECSRLNADIKAVQDAVLSKVKNDCTDALSLSDQNSTVDSMEKMEEREKMVTALSEAQKERFEIKKKQLLAAYRKDCDTFGIVVSTFLSKDPTLIDTLTGPLLESLEGMERAMLSKVDAYLEMQFV